MRNQGRRESGRVCELEMRSIRTGQEEKGKEKAKEEEKKKKKREAMRRVSGRA